MSGGSFIRLMRDKCIRLMLVDARPHLGRDWREPAVRSRRIALLRITDFYYNYGYLSDGMIWG